MKRTLTPLQLAVFLALGCVVFRLLSGLFPTAIPNLSPLMALAYVGGLYFPRRWGWLIGPAACLVTELALVPTSYHVLGTLFPWWALASLPIYFAAAGVGVFLSSRKSLGSIIAGSVALSVGFYILANTFCWAGSALTHSSPGYAPTLAGWWQANTTGLPGYAPSWTFLRNGLTGDLVFLAIFLLILDRSLVLDLLAGRSRAVSRPA